LYAHVAVLATGMHQKKNTISPGPSTATKRETGSGHPRQEGSKMSASEGKATSDQVVTIDRDIYDHLGPLHQMTVDILVGKGKWKLREPGVKADAAE